MCTCNLQQALAVLTPRKHAGALFERYEAATATAAGAWAAGVPRAAGARFELSATNAWPAAFPMPDGARGRRDLYSSSAHAGLRGGVRGSEGTGRVFTTGMGAASGLGSLYAGRGDYSSSNSGHFGEKADKGYVPNLGYRTARGDYAAPYGSSPSSRYGAGMLHPRGNRLPDDLEQLLSDAAAYRNRHRLASLCFQLLKLIILARSL